MSSYKSTVSVPSFYGKQRIRIDLNEGVTITPMPSALDIPYGATSEDEGEMKIY